MKPVPSRGEVWLACFDPVEGHEQGGRRPCLILSDDLLNHGPAELVVVLPITSRQHDIPLRIRVEPPEGGVKLTSFIMPEMIRSISTRRLLESWGRVNADTLATVEEHVKTLLGLP